MAAVAALLTLAALLPARPSAPAQAVANPAPVIPAIATVSAATSAPEPAPAPAPTPEPPLSEPPRLAVPGDAKVPVLMYHVVGEPQGPYPELYVRPGEFRRQVQWLREQGFHTVTLQQVLDHWEKGAPLPPKPVVLTFDDGYASDYRHVFPTLRQNGFVATLFAFPNSIETAGHVTRAQLREMAGAGFEIGSHTMSHPNLTKLSPERRQTELTRSKAWLEEAIGKPVQVLAYPAGNYDAATMEATAAAGYRGAVTTRYGPAERGAPYEIKRIRINGSDSLETFARKLQAAG